MSATASPAGSIGDRVQVIAAIPDGTCADCLAGHQAICPNQLSMGYQFPGGFAEYMIVPREVLAVDGLNRIPDEPRASPRRRSPSRWPACSTARNSRGSATGDTVVVDRLRARSAACTCDSPAPAARLAIILIDSQSPSGWRRGRRLVRPRSHRRHGRRQDPVAAVLDATGGRGADVVITAAASGAAQEQGLPMLARRGRLSLFGGLPEGRSDDHASTPTSCTTASSPLVGVNGSTPGAQQARTRADRLGRRARRRPDHPPLPARRGARGASRSSRAAKPSKSPSSPRETIGDHRSSRDRSTKEKTCQNDRHRRLERRPARPSRLAVQPGRRQDRRATSR